MTQTWYLSRHHKLFQKYGLLREGEDSEDLLDHVQSISIKSCAGILTQQLVVKGEKIQ